MRPTLSPPTLSMTSDDARFPMFVLPTRATTKLEWLTIRITALILTGDLETAQLLTDYVVHHLDGQDGYDIGGES